MVYPPGWGGSYNPSLDPIYPIEAGPLVYDPITGLPTTTSDIQSTLREAYPTNWSGGIGWLGQTDTSISSTDDTDTYLPILDTSATDVALTDTLPVSDLTSSDLAYLDAALSPPSNLSTATGPISASGTAVTPVAVDPSLVAAINALPTGSTIPPGSLPSTAQLATIATQGTSTGLTAAQISQIFTSAAQSGVAIFKATSSPSLIPGTNLVYNPATGQIANALTGLTGSQVASSLTSLMPMLLIGLGLILVLSMAGKK
jgi:hypothetical protein